MNSAHDHHCGPGGDCPMCGERPAYCPECGRDVGDVGSGEARLVYGEEWCAECAEEEDDD